MNSHRRQAIERGAAGAPLCAVADVRNAPPRRRSVARRKATDLVIEGFSWIGASFGIAVMGFIVWEVVVRGAGALDWAFFTQPTPQDVTSSAGGFAKDTTPFSEFLWADFLRRRIKPRLLETDFDAALEKALKIARSKDAAFLPGWCGPNPIG